MTTPAELIADAIGVDARLAATIADRMTAVTVTDAANAGILSYVARASLEALQAEALAARPPVTKDSRAKAWLIERGIDLKTKMGEQKLKWYQIALSAIDAMDDKSSHTSRAVADLTKKAHHTAADALTLANARLADRYAAKVPA